MLQDDDSRDSSLPDRYMTWRDIADLLHCGRNKALLILHEVPQVRCIGRTPMVRRSELEAFLNGKKFLDLPWPK